MPARALTVNELPNPVATSVPVPGRRDVWSVPEGQARCGFEWASDTPKWPYICTRAPHRSGKHVAGGGNEVVAVRDVA